jgi:hypothetical protein
VARLDTDGLARLVERLTERDREILRLLYDHTVLTTAQVCDVGFSNLRVAERRLHTLHVLRAVTRVRPRSFGPYHWLLDEGGAEVIAAQRGIEVAALGWNLRTALRVILHGRQTDHLLGVNGFFTALIRASREPGSDGRLVEWWPERRCAAEWGRYVRPDAFGEWSEGGGLTRFLLEYDRGTECGDQVLSKLPGYAKLAEATRGAATWWLLFRFHSERRERNVRRLLERGPSVGNVATAPLGEGASPSSRVWRPLGDDHNPRTLGELGV